MMLILSVICALAGLGCVIVWTERRRLLVESSLRRQQQRQAKAERERPALESARQRDELFERRWRSFQAQFRRHGFQSDLPF